MLLTSTLSFPPTMVTPSRGTRIFRDKLSAMRRSKNLTQQKFAEKCGVSINTVKRWLSRKNATPILDFESMSAIAKVFAITVGQLSEEIGVPGEMEDGVNPRAMMLPPIYDIDVSATIWVHVGIAELNTNNARDRAILADGRFELRIVGDCMEPAYPDGSIVRCRIIDTGLEMMPVKSAYIFCRDDGTATFKALVKRDGEEFVLAAINQQKYRGTIRVPTNEIVRIAKAVGITSPNPKFDLNIE
jgi:transcriptional regulator with XRE-family HTH domain